MHEHNEQCTQAHMCMNIINIARRHTHTGINIRNTALNTHEHIHSAQRHTYTHTPNGKTLPDSSNNCTATYAQLTDRGSLEKVTCIAQTGVKQGTAYCHRWPGDGKANDRCCCARVFVNANTARAAVIVSAWMGSAALTAALLTQVRWPKFPARDKQVVNLKNKCLISSLTYCGPSEVEHHGIKLQTRSRQPRETNMEKASRDGDLYNRSRQMSRTKPFFYIFLNYFFSLLF